MKIIQNIGLLTVIAAILTFIGMLGLGGNTLQLENIPGKTSYHKEAITEAAKNAGIIGKEINSISFISSFKSILKEAQEAQSNAVIPDGTGEWDVKIGNWEIDGFLKDTVSQTSDGPVQRNPLLFLFLTFGLGIIGGLMFILPKFREHAGIKHNGIYHDSATRGLKFNLRTGFLATATIGILVYGFLKEGNLFWPIVVSMVDPVSRKLNGGPASQWFLYGFLYTLTILVMGVRMLSKYQHNRYQQVRTLSVMFFQTTFAFMIPQILSKLNQPSVDLKNMWPLDYSFFFDYRIDNLIAEGTIGTFMFGWGIALFVIGVPLFTVVD